MDENLLRDFAHSFELIVCSMDAAESWYDLSSKNYYKFQEPKGDSALQWKDKGYAVIFDVLQVNITNSFQVFY